MHILHVLATHSTNGALVSGDNEGYIIEYEMFKAEETLFCLFDSASQIPKIASLLWSITKTKILDCYIKIQLSKS